MALPRTGKFPSTDVLWSGGEKFNGFYLFGFVNPTTGGTDFTSTDFAPFYPEQKLPSRIRIPVVDGKFNTNLGLYYNADLTPPNNKYVIIGVYDTTGRQISGNSATFSVTANPISTIPSVTLTTPSAGSAVPSTD